MKRVPRYFHLSLTSPVGLAVVFSVVCSPYFINLGSASLWDSSESLVGYFRVNVPSMVYYLRRPVFEEFDADAMVRRLKTKKHVFCVMTERHYDYFVGERDLVLYVLDRRSRLVTSLNSWLDSNRNMVDRELLVVSNRP